MNENTENLCRGESESRRHYSVVALAENIGRKVFLFFNTVKGLIAFTLISLGVLIYKFNKGSCIIHPLIRQQARRCGTELLPIVIFISLAIGFLLIGQTIAILSRFGVKDLIGVLMVSVVIRELGALAAAFIILGKVGTGIVIELATSRALKEVETLETLGVDPVHYLVVPRIVGVIAGTISLTVYLIVGGIISGYLFAFLQEVPIQPLDYFRQIADALSYLDFAIIFIKGAGFGLIISITACYHGLAKPINLNMISKATTSAIMQSIVGCVILDALVIVVYLVLLA
jgi:phospholipid/cholesterol/gamma-HCH transport system permease protein